MPAFKGRTRPLVVALSLLAGAATQAQELILEEVVVTARKRAESMQETPLAVTALDAESLREAGVRNLADLNNVAPNIEVQSANGNAPLANIYIRGVGQRNTGANIDSGVGIYIDDVYVSRPDGALLDINDIQSIQVLRGPQGTLFGKNTTGGALVFTTNRPVDEVEGSVGVRVGNYDRLDGEFVFNLPLTDILATRISGVAINRDGHIKNRFDGDDYMDEDRQSVIWQTRLSPSDSLALNLNLNYAKTEQLARPQKCLPVPEIRGWQAELFNVLAIRPSTANSPGGPRDLDDFCQDAADAGDERTVISDLGGRYESENKGVSLVVEWDISEDLSFKSVSGWRGTEAGQDDELDHTGIPFLHRTNFEHPYSDLSQSDQYSQEFQLIGSAFDDRMQYVTGVYWFQEETDNRKNVNFLGPFDPAISNLFFLNTSASELSADNKALAVFAQVEWQYNDNWRSTLGLRYTDEERELARDRQQVDPPTLDLNGGPVSPVGGGLFFVGRPNFEYNPNFGFIPLDYTEEKVTNDDISPMASIQYLIDGGDVIDTGSVYLTYSEGFLSGGLSEAPTGELEEFDPEEVENLELGFKLDLLDRRLRLNGAFFYSDYKNRQLTTVIINPITNSPAGATINAKESTIKGFELETTWLATDNLMINFNVTLSDGEIKEFDDTKVTLAETAEPAPGCVRADLTVVQVDSCPNDRSSENLPRLPEETYLLAAQYTWNTSLGTIMPRIQASLKRDIEYCFDSTSCDLGILFEDEQFDLSARVTWVSENEHWVGAIYGSNLTDEDYVVGGTALTESAGVAGYSVAPPRLYGAEIQYRF